MLSPTNIVSLDQGKAPVRCEDAYYSRAIEWKAPAGLGRFLGWLRPARPEPAADIGLPEPQVR